MPTLITAGDGSNGAVITSASDNSLTIQTGAAGAKVNAIALASDGTATLLQPPKLAATATVSMVRLNTANGFGSTNTLIRRFTNTVTNQGSDITYADSATLGASFTINTSGVYAIEYEDAFNASQYFGVSVNTSAPTTGIASIPVGERIAMQVTVNTNNIGSLSVTQYFAAGSVLRPHVNAASTGTPGGTAVPQFTITRVA